MSSGSRGYDTNQDKRRPALRHIIIKTAYVKDKEKNLKGSQRETVTYKGAVIKKNSQQI